MDVCHALQVSTVAGWSYVFYRTWDGTGVFSLAYYIAIIISVLIVMNLLLAGAYLFPSMFLVTSPKYVDALSPSCNSLELLRLSMIYN
jgi:hypothetical protein